MERRELLMKQKKKKDTYYKQKFFGVEDTKQVTVKP